MCPFRALSPAPCNIPSASLLLVSPFPALQVISTVGFAPVLVGPIRAARNLESIAELWIHMNIRYGFSNRSGFAFDLLQG